jgi:phage gp45-like
MAIQFNDASQFINAPSATVLDINATDEIELNATLVDVNANINVQGTYIGGGLMQTGGSIVIPDAGNIGSASDTDSIAIASDGVVTLTQKLIGTELDISGNMDIDGTSNLDVVDIDGAVDMASTLQVDGAITGSSTIQGTTITATTAFVPDASDGAALGTSSLEFSDLFLADASTIQFGADQDVTLTHVADTGLLLNGTSQLQFNDASQNITAPSATVLDINATDEIELNATLIDINGNVEILGTTTQTGISTSTAKDVFNAGLSVKNGSTSAGFVEFFEDSDNGTNKVTVIGPSSTSDVTLTLPNSAGTIATTATAADEATALAIALG